MEHEIPQRVKEIQKGWKGQRDEKKEEKNESNRQEATNEKEKEANL